MSVAKLQAELETARQARDQGRISQAEYISFHAKQSALIAQAKAAEQTPTTGQPIEESQYYTRPQIQATIQANLADPNVKEKLPAGAVITGYDAQKNEVAYRTAEQEQAYQSSVGFYTNIGQPQYAGKYAAPNIPEGQKVTSVQQTPQGLQFTLAPTTTQPQPQQQQPKFDMPFSNGNLPMQNPLGGKVLASTPEGRAAGLAVVAPMLAPAAGVSVASVVGGELFGAGFSGATEYLQTGRVTPRNVLEGAMYGGAFTMVGGATMSLAGRAIGGNVGALVSGASKPVGASTTQKVIAAGTRIGVNTGLGAGGGAGLEYINTGEITEQGVIQGAAFGAAFGFAGEAIGHGGSFLNRKYSIGERVTKVQNEIPIPKYGNVEIPMSTGERIAYRGLYLSKGAEAHSIIGRTSPVAKGSSISEQYVPRSNIESYVTTDVMAKAGYSPKALEAVSDVRTVMKTTQYVKPKTIDDVFPSRTSTLSETGTSTVKSFVVRNEGQVDMVYGSYATKPQLSKQFEYMKDGKSALREPGDIDIQLNVGQKQAESFASKLVTELQAKGEPVRVSTEKPTLIEADVGGGKYAHAVDIHFKGETPTDTLTPIKDDMRWGLRLNKDPVRIENIRAMSLTEQGIRKGTAILGFTEEQGVGPKSWRGKDAPDFFQAQKTLLEQMPKEKTTQAMESFERARGYYGVTEKSEVPISNREHFVYTPTKQQQQPRITSSPISFQPKKDSKEQVSLARESSKPISQPSTSIGLITSTPRSIGYSYRPQKSIPSYKPEATTTTLSPNISVPKTSKPTETSSPNLIDNYPQPSPPLYTYKLTDELPQSKPYPSPYRDDTSRPINTPFFSGGQAMEHSGMALDTPKFTGKRSVKRIYPIMTPEDFF